MIPAMLKSKIWYLQRIRLFKEMTPEEMEELDRKVQMVSVRRKTALFFPGDPGQHVYALKEGRVKIGRISKTGRVVTLAILEPGEIFGETELFDDTSRSTLAEALEDSKLCVIPKDHFLSILRKKPEVFFLLTKMICSRAKQIESRVEDLAFLDVPSRLLRLLTQLSRDYGKNLPRGIRLELKITHLELANLIGSIRETVSATLGEFRNQGLIDFDGRRIVLLHPDRPKQKTA
ncbi:Crp/Fnr family transcriptional regulator [Nitrospiraceae bacterium HYJII51-Mn-bac16s-1-B09]|uniref:Crp/Fnr family transcriptional regulator n=2 Tax=Candidatus Manganitrophus noduliformans TaxID=2606439 RepID=A0A7X6DN88_9BACT|nr:Crp/Fnr family transcriptional regulator [Candidatus Manganitrophus noduliformans]